jgi:hypothetical protein
MTGLQSPKTRFLLPNITLVIVLAAIFGILPTARTFAEGVPKVEIPETSHDFGKILRDQSPFYSFVIKNTGNAPLAIIEVDPDCTCTLAKYDRHIPPGGQGQITLAIKPNSVEGHFRKQTKVRFNDPENPLVVLAMTGVAQSLVDVEPGRVIRFKGKAGAEHRAQVRLISHLKEPLEIKRYQTNIPQFIKVSLKTEKPGRDYLLEVQNITHEPGNYSGIIELFTNAKRKPHIVIRVFAFLKADGKIAQGK